MSVNGAESQEFSRHVNQSLLKEYGFMAKWNQHCTIYMLHKILVQPALAQQIKLDLEGPFNS